MSPAPVDPRAQREAVSVAERLVRAFLEGHAELVGELAGKVEELDGLGNYVTLVAAAREWLSAGRLGPTGGGGKAAHGRRSRRGPARLFAGLRRGELIEEAPPPSPAGCR